jgi:hypothetical protein
VGDSQWRALGELFPDAIPQAAAGAETPMAAAVQAGGKQSGGCRVALGATLLVFGLLMFVGGLALAAATPYIYSMPLCPIAEEDWSKLEELKKKYDAAEPTDKYMIEYDLKRAFADYDSSSAMCAKEKGTRSMFIVGEIAVAVVGLFAAVIGFFLRRVPKVTETGS